MTLGLLYMLGQLISECLMTFCGRLYCSTFGSSPWEFLLFAVNTQAWCGELSGRHNFMPNILIIRRPACYVEAQGQPNISWNLHIANCCSSTFENHFRLSENFKVGSWTVLNALITNMQYLRCCSVKKYLVVIPN